MLIQSESPKAQQKEYLLNLVGLQCILSLDLGWKLDKACGTHSFTAGPGASLCLNNIHQVML